MGLKLPYNGFELRFALFDAEKYLTDENGEKIQKIIEGKMPEMASTAPKSALNKAVAEDNGISVEALINSPNYETLVEEYRGERAKMVVEVMKEVTGMPDKTAWAILLSATGSLGLD